MPEPLSAWKYLLWTPALPSTQHKQLWELFKQTRSSDRRRLIWRDEGIRKWNLHWCAEGMEREYPEDHCGRLHYSWAFCAYAEEERRSFLGGFCALKRERCGGVLCRRFWFVEFWCLVPVNSLSAKVQLEAAGSFPQLRGLFSAAATLMMEKKRPRGQQHGWMKVCPTIFSELSSLDSD